ncbi:MAG: GNAT family N-acetyltransferase [Bacteroidales bacterium]|jgi:GNAT superfamily N-acetyltransferase|nr:GNAT family N-acetyltransferase [Bacteroidales bacterium]
MAEVSFDITPADKPVLKKILASSGYFYDFEIEVALSLADETLKSGQEKSGYYWIRLIEDGVLIGFANFGPNPSSMHSWDLYWLAMQEEYRQKHYGSVILKEVENRVRLLGARILWIETSGRPQYEPTRHFYLKNGYELEATLREFYGPDDHKLVYRKVL